MTDDHGFSKLNDSMRASVREQLERSRRAFANPRDEDERKILAVIEKQLAELGT